MKNLESMEAIVAALSSVFGEEWKALSPADRLLIVMDCTEEGGVQDFRQYAKDIGEGNLQSYAITQRARFATKVEPVPMKVVALTREEYERVLYHLTGIVHDNPLVWQLRVGIDRDGVKFSINNGTWTPGFGTVQK